MNDIKHKIYQVKFFEEKMAKFKDEQKLVQNYNQLSRGIRESNPLMFRMKKNMTPKKKEITEDKEYIL